jgi:DNA adenine methylase
MGNCLLKIGRMNINKHEMNDREHIELLEALLNHPGKVLLSGYDNDLYNYYLSGWKKASKKTTAENGLLRTEMLWMNYSVGQMKIADYMVI